MKRFFQYPWAVMAYLFFLTVFLSAQEAELQKAEELTAKAYQFYQQGQYDQALRLLQEALQLQEQVLGTDNIEVAASLNNVAELYRATGAYSKAEPLFLRALKIYETQLGPDHQDVATSLNYLALLYQDIGEYSRAQPLFQRALKIREAKLGPDHLDVAQSLNNLALLYHDMSAYSMAEPLYQQALKIRKTKLGPDHPDVAQSLNNLALLYHTIGVYDQAESLYKHALKIKETKLGLDHPNLATSLNNLAGLYQTMGAYNKAEPLLQRAIKIVETKLGPEHQKVAKSLNNLATLYNNMGKYSKAEPLLQRALKICETQLGPNHPEVATSLNNLAVFYKNMGAYSKAEPLYQRALKVWETQLGPEHPDVATSLNNLAKLYQTMGANVQAEQLYKQALKIYETHLGPEHPKVATSLNSLAGLYQAIGAYSKTEPLLQLALKIREEKLGPNHPDVAQSLDNLAILYRATGAYSKAEVLFQRAMKIQETQLGPEHPDVAQSLNNLAILYRETGAYSKAEPLYQRALNICEMQLGPDHPNVATSLNNLLFLMGDQGKIKQITLLAQRLMQFNFKHYHTILPYLSEKRQLNYIQQNSPLSPLWPSLYTQYGREATDLKSLTTDVLLNQKGIVYEMLTSRTQDDSLNSIRAQLANAYLIEPVKIKNPDQHLNYLKTLQDQQERLETQLARQGYESEIKKTPFKSEELSQKLAEDYGLIDFWYFPQYDFISEKKGWGTWQYLAVVYQKNQTPEIVPLGEADSLHKSLSEFFQAIFTAELDPAQTRQQYLAAEANVKTKGQQLYRQLFQPLLAVIGDKKKLIICADGELHYLPFGVLVDNQNRYLVESYQFHYVSTARELLKWKSGARPALRDAVIIADPQYDTALVDASTNGSGIITSRSREWRQMSFIALKHTRPEAIAIDSLLKENKIATKLYLKGQAQESVLKAVHSPQILHLSSDGFFLPAPEPVNPTGAAGLASFASPVHQGLVENPLVRCGLALAGANRAESIPGSDDGLATALEIAGLDLAGTDLVTLSACQTGIGDLKNGEGLYGLQRSFLLAGAKTVLASLWSVPDLETKDLMIEFYRRYLSDVNISKTEALRQAQLAVIKSLREKYGVAPPAYWGAFVCIGEM